MIYVIKGVGGEAALLGDVDWILKLGEKVTPTRLGTPPETS